MEARRPRGRAGPAWTVWLPALVLVAATGTRAANLTHAAYAFDTDPGPGGGTLVALPPGDEAALLIEPTAPAGPGLHYLYLRVRDSDGRWSPVECRPFVVDAPQALVQPVVDAAETAFAFVAPGTGEPLGPTPGSEVSIAAGLSVDGLGEGLHPLLLRVRDSSGRWSVAESRVFYRVALTEPGASLVTAAEIFFDADPGPGSGTPLTVVADERVDLVGLLDTSALEPGFHFLTLRARDGAGRWSVRETRLLLLEGEPTPPSGVTLAGAEWFVNEDPGIGLGVPVSLPADGAWSELEEDLVEAVTGLPVGRHLFGLRVRDSLGRWSPTRRDSTLVGPLLHILAAAPPASLSWEGDLEGDLVYIHRSESYGGSWAVVDSTTASWWIDPQTPPDNGRRWYRVTQKLDPQLTAYRLPEPSGPDAEPNRRAKTPPPAEPGDRQSAARDD